MAIITKIENAIIQLGPGEFQKFCDTFLAKKHAYGLIHGYGMKTGTLKTTIGNPDTYFRGNDGKYIFVAYTTQQNNIVSKLEEDIKKCLDPNKTGISSEDICEIICCHTSSNLSAGDDKKLHEICNLQGVKLTIYGVDELAQQIYSNYQVLGRDFLDIHIDTNQLLDVEDFVRVYDASKTVAPLNTIFQNRKELDSIIDGIRNNDVVIVHGAAGVGKTRIVLEAAKSVAEKEGYCLLCVKNNNIPLYEDLIAYTEKSGKYLFFIDDANELAQLNIVLEFLRKKDSIYKIIMTVRDYAKEGVVRDVMKVVRPLLIKIAPVTDAEISKFLDVNLGIKNCQFVEAISKIAEGNLRIAYMAGKIAVERDSLMAVHDATQVYEQYYESVIDSKLNRENSLCLTAGILALVKAVMVDKLDPLKEMIDDAGLSIKEYIFSINRLSQMEVVELHKDKVAAFSDQCFSNYILYYVFFDRKMIPFSRVLHAGITHFKNGVIQSVNTLLNIFSKPELREYIREEVKKTWDSLYNERAYCFKEFAREFHVFCPEDSFLLAKDMIDKIPVQQTETIIDFNRNVYGFKDDILSFLSGYNTSDYIVTAIELFFDYVEKSDDNAIEGLHWLKNNYGINSHTFNSDYYDICICTKILHERMQSSNIIQQMALEFVKYLLEFEFHSSELGHNDVINMYTLQLRKSNGVSIFRENSWNILIDLSSEKKYANIIYSILINYAKTIIGAEDNNIVRDDQFFVKKVLFSLKSNEVLNALVIRYLENAYNKKDIEFTIETECFKSPEWQLFEQLGDRWMYSDISFEEYEEERNNRIKQYADSLSSEDITECITMGKRLLDLIDNENKYSVKEGIDRVIYSLCQDHEKAMILYNLFLHDDVSDFDITGVLQIMFSVLSAEKIWADLFVANTAKKNYWQYLYFVLIPEEMINETIYRFLLCYFEDDSDKDMDQSSYRNLHFLDKFIKVNRDIYVDAAELIFEKRKYSESIVEKYFTLLFNDSVYSSSKLLELFSKDINLLGEIFFFMMERGDYIATKGFFIIELLKYDDKWVHIFAESICKLILEDARIENYYSFFQAIWRTDRYLDYYDTIFIYICEKCDKNIYKWKLEKIFKCLLSRDTKNTETVKRQEAWVIKFIRQYSDSPYIGYLFEALVGADLSLRKIAFHEFLIKNTDYEMFEKLPLDSESWGGVVDSIVPELKRRIQFLEMLLEDTQGTKYLKHAKRIRNRIGLWEKEIREEEIEEICRKLYR